VTRLILFLLILVLGYWLVRNVIQAFLRGLGLGNENVRSEKPVRPKQEYNDVQDAEFTDITDDSPDAPRDGR